MSTTAPSEFIIGHSADDAADRRAELRKIGWALLAALILHLVIGCCIALFHDKLFTRVEPVEEDKPVELTIVDLPAQQPAVPQKNTMFMETDESKASKEAPKDKTFESNANSIAASQQPATGGMPLPSQEGKERPNIDLESHSYSLPSEGAQPQPSVAQATPQPSASVQPTPEATPDSQQLAMLTNRPTPAPTVAQTPAPVRTRYQPLKQQTRISGAITNRGTSSINALGTPLGRYQKIVIDSIGSRWYAYVERRGESANVGDVVIGFVIDRSGRLKNMRVVKNTSNETFANICLQAIQDSPLPPIPDDVASTLPPEGLEVEGLRFSMIQ